MTEPVVNPQEWFACAGRMAQVPSVGSKVFYYPQGHAEHVCALDRAIEGVPTMICCRVLAVRFHANSVTDEVYAALELVRCDESEVENTNINAAHVQEGPLSVRVLTSSDISDSLSVLDDCVENIFPRINSPYNHGSQVISAKDIHGTIWWFQHMQMLNRRVNILSQGWKMYAALKKLVAGDVHVFMKVKGADPFIGIAKKVWRYKRAAPTTQEMLNAARGDPFVVRYYPRASSPQFCVDMSVVRKAMRFQWQPNMKFQKGFETEDSRGIMWFRGTVSSYFSMRRWNSVKVTWDDPVREEECVNPWEIEPILFSKNLPTFPPKGPQVQQGPESKKSRQTKSLGRNFPGQTSTCQEEYQREEENPQEAVGLDVVVDPETAVLILDSEQVEEVRREDVVCVKKKSATLAVSLFTLNASQICIDLHALTVKDKEYTEDVSGSIGLMGLVSQAVHNGDRHVIGVIPKTLVPRVLTCETVGEVKAVADMHKRKAEMAKHSDAFIALLGGYGTLEELLEVITWAQVGIHDKPVELLNVDGYCYQLLTKLWKRVSLVQVHDVSVSLHQLQKSW